MHGHARFQPVSAFGPPIFDLPGPRPKQPQASAASAAWYCLLRLPRRGIERLCGIPENKDDVPALKRELQDHLVVGTEAAMFVQVGDEFLDHNGELRDIALFDTPLFAELARRQRGIVNRGLP